MHGEYYQAKAYGPKLWFIAGCLRNEDHWCFDRTLDGTSDMVEFFVAPCYEEEFLSIMKIFENNGYITNLKKLPNRALGKKYLTD